MTQKPDHLAVQALANAWIARNIMVGPFSTDDLPIYDVPIAALRKKAARAGFSEQDLETVLGPLPEFMARAYADAIARWRAEQAFEKGE